AAPVFEIVGRDGAGPGRAGIVAENPVGRPVLAGAYVEREDLAVLDGFVHHGVEIVPDVCDSAVVVDLDGLPIEAHDYAGDVRIAPRRFDEFADRSLGWTELIG